MKMHKLLALFLALCLLLAAAPAALAAPMRDMQQADILLQDIGLTSLLETVLGGAVLQGVEKLEEGKSPSQTLAEGVLAVGLNQLTLPYTEEDIWDGKASLDAAALDSMLGNLFQNPQVSFTADTMCPGVEKTETGLNFDFSALEGNPVVGAYAYNAQDQNGETVIVLCDLYTHYDGEDGNAETLPEDALTWLCNASVTLVRAPEALFGYKVAAFALSETYQDGMVANWELVENTEFEYSVTLPFILGLADDTPRNMVWQTADGTATLTIKAVDQTGEGWEAYYNAMLDEFRKQHQGETITDRMEFGMFYAEGEGVYTLWQVPEGMNWAYEITLEFPVERQAEYMLYAEFIRNNFAVWGASNG